MDRDPTKCRARRSDGKPCGRFSTRGADVCRSHGAGAPQVRAAAAERVLDGKVRETLARLGVGEVSDPLTTLARLAAEVLAWKDATAALVNELRELRYEDSKGGEQLRSEVLLWERALDRATQVLVAMARLRLDERLVAVNEQVAAMIVRAVDAGLTAAGVTSGEARELARQAASRQLRIVSSGGGVDGA
jgi:hypothetical protein